MRPGRASSHLDINLKAKGRGYLGMFGPGYLGFVGPRGYLGNFGPGYLGTFKVNLRSVLRSF